MVTTRIETQKGDTLKCLLFYQGESGSSQHRLQCIAGAFESLVLDGPMYDVDSRAHANSRLHPHLFIVIG